ncbi:hypothetical protein V6R21_20445 [Limibacter armeniacum]|uniref:hypothetical protein n=1 Tax=Limibacter armeniacum TaxID=466084 RepID=UPI002FE5E22D
MKRLFLFLLFLSVFKISFAQITIVTFDTKTERFVDGDVEKIKFDEPFQIKISDPEFISIITKYGIHNHSHKAEGGIDGDKAEGKDGEEEKVIYQYKKSKHYRFFPPEQLVDNQSMIQLPEVFSNIDDFRITVDPPLHPNELYDIVFIAKKKLKLDDAVITNLRTDITDRIEETFHYTKDAISKAEIKTMYQDVSSLIVKATNSNSLFNKDGERVDLNNPFNNTNVTMHYDKLVKVQLNLNELTDKICGKKGGGVDETTPGYAYQYYDIMKKHINKDELLASIKEILSDEYFKDFLNAPVNSVIDPDLKNEHIITIIKRDLETTSVDLSEYVNSDICACEILNENIHQLLAGQGKITGNIVLPSINYDLVGGQILLSLLLNLKSLEDVNGEGVFQKSQDLDKLINVVKCWVIDVDKFNKLQGKRKTIKESFPDILDGVYTNWYSTTNISLYAPVDTQETPYVGVDFGFVVAPDISTTFAFEGINFHLRPVNRNAKFSYLKGIDWWLKRTSFTIGMAQRINTTNDRFDKLTSIGSPLIGVGFRINRMIRVGAVSLFYKEKNENPVIEDVNTKNTWAITMSLDTELRNLGSFFVKLLNF